MALFGTWWAWICIGIVLVMLELMLPSYFFLGFGIGAVLTGLVLLTGMTLTVQSVFLTFSILSFISWIVVRRAFRHPNSDAKTFDRDINDG